jgi:hypothetical protein
VGAANLCHLRAGRQFLDALDKIRGIAWGCAYTIPVPASGTPDYGNVNVQYVPNPGATPVVIPKVNDPSKCPFSGDAW